MEPKTTYKSALTMDQAKLTQHKSAVEITHHHDVPAATDSLEIISHDEDETVTAAADSLEIVSHDETVTAPADSLEIIPHGTTTANYWPVAQIYSQGENFSL
jgi:hypothetical protein